MHGWDSMRDMRKLLFIVVGLLMISWCSLLVTAQQGSAFDSMSESQTFIVIIGIAAIIVALLTAGGIKYVTPDNVLDTDVRKNLFKYIDEYPGSHLREIARELDLKPSNAAWHLRKLEQTNLIRSRSIGGKKVYYLVEGGIDSRREAVASSILRNENALNIMNYLLKHPNKHLLEIAHALDLNHHTVKWHIKKMYVAELINGDTSNSSYPVYYPTETGIYVMKQIDKKSIGKGQAS